jgi:site-specific DNA-methyltransferase (adenine-specific)
MVIKLQVVERKLKDIKPYERNPRKNKRAVAAVKRSIEEFGFRVPIIVDGNNVIIAGHTRYQAAKELGFDTLPALDGSDLTPEQVKAYRIADNRTGDFADWDAELLNAEVADISIDLDWLELSDLGVGADFAPGSEEEQGNLSEKTPVMVVCPHCGQEFEYVVKSGS